ncbi:MAG: helix-turn-helix domain-containing protein [Burkholderiaceae bacterium]
MNPREFLKLLMDRAGDNPNSLSTKSKVPQPTIFRFLNGTAKEPRLRTMTSIARVYGVPVEAFFSDTALKETMGRLRLGNEVAEKTATFTTGAEPKQHDWPFKAFTADEVRRLTQNEIKEIEDFVRWKIDRSTGEGSKKTA